MKERIPPTTFRLTAEDRALLNAASRHLGGLSLSDTVRVVLRDWTRERGVKPQETDDR